MQPTEKRLNGKFLLVSSQVVILPVCFSLLGMSSCDKQTTLTTPNFIGEVHGLNAYSWYDASQISQSDISPGNNQVDTWRDLSGNGHDLTVPAPGQYVDSGAKTFAPTYNAKSGNTQKPSLVFNPTSYINMACLYSQTGFPTSNSFTISVVFSYQYDNGYHWNNLLETTGVTRANGVYTAKNPQYKLLLNPMVNSTSTEQLSANHPYASHYYHLNTGLTNLDTVSDVLGLAAQVMVGANLPQSSSFTQASFGQYNSSYYAPYGPPPVTNVSADQLGIGNTQFYSSPTGKSHIFTTVRTPSLENSSNYTNFLYLDGNTSVPSNWLNFLSSYGVSPSDTGFLQYPIQWPFNNMFISKNQSPADFHNGMIDPISGPITDPTFYLGCDHGGNGGDIMNPFIGEIQELVIYNQALSPSQLADLHANLQKKYSISPSDASLMPNPAWMPTSFTGCKSSNNCL